MTNPKPHKPKSKKKRKHTATPRPTLIGNKYASHPNNTGRPLEWTPERIDKETKALKEWIKNEDNFFMSGFLASRGLTYETADRLSKLNEQFCETLQFARMVQEQRLVQNSTTKKFDGNFVKFILSNRFGYRERSETQITGNPLAVLLEKIASKPQEIIEIPDSDITQGG